MLHDRITNYFQSFLKIFRYVLTNYQKIVYNEIRYAGSIRTLESSAIKILLSTSRRKSMKKLITIVVAVSLCAILFSAAMAQTRPKVLPPVPTPPDLPGFPPMDPAPEPGFCCPDCHKCHPYIPGYHCPGCCGYHHKRPNHPSLNPPQVVPQPPFVPQPQFVPQPPFAPQPLLVPQPQFVPQPLFAPQLQFEPQLVEALPQFEDALPQLEEAQPQLEYTQPQLEDAQPQLEEALPQIESQPQLAPQPQQALKPQNSPKHSILEPLQNEPTPVFQEL